MKRLKRKKGFTLIELLAVIIVLGIILVIAIPNIINLITDTKVAAYDRQKDLIVDATRKYVLQNAQNITWTDNTATIYLSDLQNYHLMDNPLRDPRGGTFNNTNKGTKVIVTRNGDQYTYEIIAVGGPHSTPPVISLIGLNPMTAFQGESYTDAGATAFDGTDGDISENITTTGSVNTATVGTYTLTYNVADSVGNNATAVTRTVNVVTYTDYATSESVNKPKLITGMTPIKWNNTEWVNTTEADADWYNYTTADKKWANAKTADGSMWVWIPRYAYQIATGYHTSTEGTINVKFLKEATNVASDNSIAYITPTYKNNSQTNYIAHPAFTFGNTELKGIWVAKFKASVSDIMNACYTNSNPTNCDKTTLFIRISPNIQSWRNINIGNMFTTIRNMEITDRYGWGSTGTGLDTHLMKNIELGAIAYLAQSTYGKNSEIWKNPANDFTTGCSADSASVQITTGCLRAYNTANGMNASTTGNIYGIYDMVGPVLEYTAAYVNNGNNNLTTYGNSILTADSKYKDVYTAAPDDDMNNYNNAATKKGDALYETSSTVGGTYAWYGDYRFMPNTTVPWFCRGGDNAFTTQSGIFHSAMCDGFPYINVSFRPILLINSGL